MRNPEDSMIGRGRVATAKLYLEFYRDRMDRIVEEKATGRPFDLMLLFSEWLVQRSLSLTPDLPSATTNVVLARVVPHWDDWLESLRIAAEIGVFELAPNLKPSPKGLGGSGGVSGNGL